MKTRFCWKALFLLVALGPMRLIAQGVSFDLQADLLQTASPGVAMPTSGLVLLVADTIRNGFGSVAVTSLGSGNGNAFSSGLALNGVGGDDLILWRSDLSGGYNTAGLLTATPSLTRGTYGGLTWDTGDPLALFWFPSLTIDSVNTAVGNSYGYITEPTPLLGQPWITPGDANLYQLYLFTTNAVSPGDAGPSAPGLLVASNTVSAVPEPGPTAMFAATAVLGFALHRRRRTLVA